MKARRWWVAVELLSLWLCQVCYGSLGDNQICVVSCLLKYYYIFFFKSEYFHSESMKEILQSLTELTY
mgnify:CR=1 FL=1